LTELEKRELKCKCIYSAAREKAATWARYFSSYQWSVTF